MSLISLIDRQSRQTFSDDQGSWRQFVIDHLSYITKRVRPTTIDDVTINQYRYDLKRYLKEKHSILEDITWIVLLLNDMSCDFEFETSGSYIIPSDGLISGLYHSYITIEKNVS